MIQQVKMAGPQGPRGASFFPGNGEPSASLGVDGDSYIDSITGNLYEKSNESWDQVGCLMGPVTAHEADAASGRVRFQNADGSWGDWIYCTLYQTTVTGNSYEMTGGIPV